jgi:serine/threonine-protein kinase 11
MWFRVISMLRRPKQRPLSFAPLLVPDREPKPPIKLNDYQFVGRLGRGGCANVHLAIDCRTNSKVAVKSIRLGSSIRLSALEREIRNMRQLSHPNVRRLLEVLHRPDNNTVYLVLEYAASSLKGHVLSEPIAAAIFAQVVSGLRHLHSVGIVHQDVKPSNILVTDAGEAKIADFGIGHTFASAHDVIGTPAYQPPEILEESTLRDPVKEDVWSLGVTLYETMFGSLPFGGDNVFEIIEAAKKFDLKMPEGASRELQTLLTGMLATLPEERLSLEDVAHHLWFAKADGVALTFADTAPKTKSLSRIQIVDAEVWKGEPMAAAKDITVLSSWPSTERSQDWNPIVC